MRRLIAFALMVTAISAVADPLPKLQIYTEHYEPYNFIDQSNPPAELKGVGVDLLEAMLARAGSDQTKASFRIVALEHGIKAAKEQRNSLVFSLARTEKREDMFKWVCPIDKLKTQLVALKSKNISINNNKDLNDYRIGTIKGDVGEQLLKKAGVHDSRLSYGNEYNNLTRLMEGRTDLYVVSMDNVESSCQDRDCTVSQFEPVYTLNVTDLCYALNKSTPDSVVSQLQAALDELRSEGRVEELKDKYSDRF
ncbi:substrate-binding periplasmic protein [Halomonadaceae bacterium KBTZ08]